jgi:transposase
MDLHRTFAEVVVWQDGRLRHAGRIDMTRSALEGFARSLHAGDEIVIEATGNAMVVSHLLTAHVARVVIANPLQVKAIAHAHVKTDKIDAGVLASLHAAGFLPEVWTPDAGTERLRRLVARRNQVVRHCTRLKNETHGILHAHLVPRCPHADLFNRAGRTWLERQVLPEDERDAVHRHVREFDRLSEDLVVLDRAIGEATVNSPAVRRLLTITGINVTVAAGLAAAIGDVRRFSNPEKLVSYSAAAGHTAAVQAAAGALPPDPNQSAVAAAQAVNAGVGSSRAAGWPGSAAGSGNRPLSEGLLATLVRRGNEMLALHDISAARLLFERAAVARSRADWGLAIETVARQYELGFIPVQPEHYDFAVPRSRRERPVVQRFLAVLAEDEVRAALAALGFAFGA